MADSVFNTVTIAVLGAPNPTSLVVGGKIPLRILVRNVGPSAVLLAMDVQALDRLPATSGTYRLDPGASDVFVLMPLQTIYASSIGAQGLLSYARSDALPAVML